MSDDEADGTRGASHSQEPEDTHRHTGRGESGASVRARRAEEVEAIKRDKRAIGKMQAGSIQVGCRHTHTHTHAQAHTHSSTRPQSSVSS